MTHTELLRSDRSLPSLVSAARCCRPECLAAPPSCADRMRPLNGISSAANITTVRGHRIHRVVVEFVGTIRRWSRIAKRAVAAPAIGFPATRQEEAHWLRAYWRPGIRRLPLVDPHCEVADLRHLLENPVLLSLEKVIEPCVGQLVIVQPSVAHAALAHHRVFRCALVGAVKCRRDHRVLLIGY